MTQEWQAELERAARGIQAAEALVIGAGAGMGVDSGLPDFRGPEGFWRAYPAYAKLGLNFMELANPRWFRRDPPLAWGFYGHRRNLYRQTRPHEGFTILRRWVERLPRGGFVFTSNVDGHFTRAGFADDRIVEVHGALEWMQCTASCGMGIFPAGPEEIPIDEGTFRALGDLPACPGCGALARPNVLMFGDWDWESARTEAQERRLRQWLSILGGARVVIVECGAGKAVPTVRHFCEQLASASGGLLVRINPRDFEVPSGQLGLPLSARRALEAIDDRVQAGSAT
jgi:NAD-dependent SIR2 family protein deacetylase